MRLPEIFKRWTFTGPRCNGILKEMVLKSDHEDVLDRAIKAEARVRRLETLAQSIVDARTTEEIFKAQERLRRAMNDRG